MTCCVALTTARRTTRGKAPQARPRPRGEADGSYRPGTGGSPPGRAPPRQSTREPERLPARRQPGAEMPRKSQGKTVTSRSPR